LRNLESEDVGNELAISIRNIQKHLVSQAGGYFPEENNKKLNLTLEKINDTIGNN
jgi:hypothetical protein